MIVIFETEVGLGSGKSMVVFDETEDVPLPRIFRIVDQKAR